MSASSPQRILLIRPSALGDVCRTVPVLVSLQKAHPGARIDWVVQDSFIPAVRAHPALNQAIAFPRGRLAGWWRHPRIAAELWRWLRSLREPRYDLVFDCQGLGRSGLIAWATKAPRRVGYDDARELGWLGCNVRHRVSQDLHSVERMLALLKCDGIEPVRDSRLYVDAADAAWWAQKRASLGIGPRRYAVLAPTSRWASKRWPAGHWSQLIAPLLDRGYERLVLIGSPDECEQVKSIRPPRASLLEALVNASGQTTIGQTLALIAGADLVIANDSAPLHMAVGFNRPLIGLFGPTDPALVGPYRRPETAIRRYHPREGESVNFKDPRIGDSLMRFIQPSDVVAKIDELGYSSRKDAQTKTQAMEGAQP